MQPYTDAENKIYAIIDEFDKYLSAENLLVEKLPAQVNINRFNEQIEYISKIQDTNINTNFLSSVATAIEVFISQGKNIYSNKSSFFQDIKNGVLQLKNIYSQLLEAKDNQEHYNMALSQEKEQIEQKHAEEIEALKNDKNQEYQNKYEQLNNDIQQLKMENQSLSNKLLAYDPKSTSKDIQKIITENDNMRKKYYVQEQRYREITNLYADCKKNYDRLDKENKKLTKDLNDLKTQNLDNEQKIKELKNDKKQLNRANDDLDKENKMLHKKNKELTMKNIDLEAKNKEIHKKINYFEKKITTPRPPTKSHDAIIDDSFDIPGSLSSSRNTNAANNMSAQIEKLKKDNQRLMQDIKNKDVQIIQLSNENKLLNIRSMNPDQNYYCRQFNGGDNQSPEINDQSQHFQGSNLHSIPENNNSELYDKINSLQIVIRMKNDEISSLNQQISLLKQNLESNYNSYQKDLLLSKEETAKKEGEIYNLNQQISILKQKLEEMSKSNQNASYYKQEISKLNHDIDLLQNTISDQENRLRTSNQEAQFYRQTASVQKSQLDELQFKYDQDHQNLINLQNYNAQTVAYKDNIIRTLAEEKQNLTKTIIDHETLITNQKNQISTLEKKNEKLQEKVDKKKSKHDLENETLSFIGGELQKVITKLEEEIQNNEKEIQRLTGQITASQCEIDKLNGENDSLKQIAEELETSNTTNSKRIHDISDENNHLKTAVDDLKKKEEKYMKEIRCLKEIINKQMILAKNEVQTNKSIETLNGETIRNLEKNGGSNVGSSGIVYKVAMKVIYALKEMKVQITPEEFQQFVAEYEMMCILEHPNIVKTHGIFLGDKITPPSILLEFCPSNLDDEIKKKQFSNIEIVFMIYQIVEGMKFVHFKKIIHRDLKPTNILIGTDKNIKISDFGISKLMSDEDFLEKMTTDKGTIKFMAPEILNEEQYNEKVDVYSFGVILFFILSGGKMPSITIIKVGKGEKAPIPESFTEFSKNLISSCWNFDPNERPSFEQIYNDIQKNDFKLVELSEQDINEVKLMVKKHKKSIPNYSSNE